MEEQKGARWMVRTTWNARGSRSDTVWTTDSITVQESTRVARVGNTNVLEVLRWGWTLALWPYILAFTGLTTKNPATLLIQKGAEKMPTGFLTSSQPPLHIFKSTRRSTKIRHTLPGHSKEQNWFSLFKYVKEKFNILENFCLFCTFWDENFHIIHVSISYFCQCLNISGD